jgi:hypothetical protein
MAKSKKTIAFEFVLEELHRLNPIVKPMFGSHAVYVQNKIVFILRKRESGTEDNGVWIATTAEHHESLRKELPSLRSIGVFGGGETGWQVLPADADDFEESVLHACALVLRHDLRIGKIPRQKKKKKTL